MDQRADPREIDDKKKPLLRFLKAGVVNLMVVVVSRVELGAATEVILRDAKPFCDYIPLQREPWFLLGLRQ